MERNGLMEKFGTLLLAEETYWKQRSKIQWLKSGDPNTHFFHQHANYRKRKNWIEGLTNQHGSWESSDAVSGEARNWPGGRGGILQDKKS